MIHEFTFHDEECAVFLSFSNSADTKEEALDLAKENQTSVPGCLSRRQGVDDFHDLRHPFATRAAIEGHPTTSIAKMLGHADLRMTAPIRPSNR